MIAKMLKHVGEFIARMPGLPILVGIGLTLLGLILQFLPGDWAVIGWLAQTNLLLHLGVIIGFLGLLLGDAL
jgi:hypothetical protein